MGKIIIKQLMNRKKKGGEKMNPPTQKEPKSIRMKKIKDSFSKSVKTNG